MSVPPDLGVPDPELFDYMTEDERATFDLLLTGDRKPWRPLDGPQSMAYASGATIIGFGGAAGGGKSDLAIGKALTQHRRCIIFRRTGPELVAINDRITELLGTRELFNGRDSIWRFERDEGTDVQIELGSFPNLGDETKYRGRPHDLVVFDEASDMREQQVRFLLGWLRTTVPDQPCQCLLTFNPPTSVEGRWIIGFFGPWLDKHHPNPAEPGELRWFATPKGRDIEVADGRPFVLVDGEVCYEFDPKDHRPSDIFQPLSRTFVPSRISDNPHLLGTGYMAQLQSLEEPFRSMMLHGDFAASIEDDPYQVIPTAWVEAAMERWSKPSKLTTMDSMGVDVAMGGRDFTVIARRHGMWFDRMIAHPGNTTPDGPTTAGLVIGAMRDSAVIHVDVFGVGAHTFGALMAANQQTIGVNFGELARGMDVSGRHGFKNLRSELWWRMREALDPQANTGIALPPDKRLLADLCAPTWELVGRVLQVASRDEIVARIGRSPDWGTAAVLALMDTIKMRDAQRIGRARMQEHNPYDVVDRVIRPREHDPYAI